METTGAKVIIASPVSYKLFNDVPFFTGIDWIKSVLAQDYPELSVYVLGNDLLPDMLDEMRNEADSRTTIEHITLGNTPDIRGKRKSSDKTYKRFAEVRNMVLNYVLSTDADYYVSIDSDIIVHPDTVSRLVSQMEQRPEYGMIAAIVNNTRRIGADREYPSAIYNFGILKSKIRHDDKEQQYERQRKFKKGGFMDVGYTGACMIIKTDILRSHPDVMWGPHKNGEDLYMCERMREAGYRIGVDTSIVTLHKMDQTVWTRDIETFNRGEFV